MPNFNSSFRKFRRGLALAAAMAALAGLQGCFETADEDSPYSIPKGQSIDGAQLEIEPDGTVLLLAKVAMYYAHANPLNEWEREPQMRNIESVMYRRTEGGWSATSFKNLQNQANALPIMIPDAQGRMHALVWNSTSIRRYRFIDGTWSPRRATAYPQYFQQMYQYSYRNWGRHPMVGIEDDTLVMTLEFDPNTYQGIMVRDGAAPKAIQFDTGSAYSSVAMHVGKDYRAVVVEQSAFNFGPDPTNAPPKLVLFHWLRGESEAEKVILSEGRVRECFFSPYRGGTGLFVLQDTAFQVFRLDETGKPEFGVRTGVPGPALKGMPMVAADTAGCYQGLSETTDIERRVPSFTSWNSCQPADTLALNLPLVAGPAEYYRTTSIGFRIGPTGPVAALVITKGENDPNKSFSRGRQPSWLYFAELRNGQWVVETVANK